MADPVVKVVSPDGQPGEIPAAQLQDAVDQGYRELTPDVQAELVRHEKYGGVLGGVGATLAGGARGATLGISDAVLTGTGLVEPKTLGDLKAEHPELSTAAELGGMFLPVAAPVKATTAIGGAVEKAASSLLGGKLAAKLAGAAARGATEAELFNIGHNLSEASLGDERVTAERLLANSGDALSIGAGLGFGLSAGGMAVKAAAQKTADALNGLSTFVAEKFPGANSEILNNYAEKTASRVGMKPEEVKALFEKAGTKEGAELRANLKTADFVSPQERDEINRAFKEHLESAREAVSESKAKAFDEFRPREVENLVADLHPERASESAYKLSDDMANAAKAMRDNPDKFTKNLVSKLEEVEAGYTKRLLKIEAPAELFKLINETKQTLDKQILRWGKSISPEHGETVDVITGLRSALRDNLENEVIWGSAAARQSAFNEASSRLATAEQRLFGKGSKVGEFGKVVVGRGGRPTVEVSSKKINTFLSQTGAARSETAEQALREYIDAAKAFAGQVEQSAGSAGVDYSSDGARSLLEKATKIADEAEKKLALESKVRQAARLDDIGYNMFPGAAGAAMGAAMHSVPGAAALGLGARAVGGAVVDALSAGVNPIAAAKTLSRVEGFALGTAKKMAKAIDGMTKLAETAGQNAADRGALGAVMWVAPHNDDAVTRFERAKTQVRDIQASGVGQLTAYHAGTAGLEDHAPVTQRAVVDTQMRIGAFLQSKLPSDPFAASTMNPRQSTWRPSDAEMARYQRYHSAATNPLGAIQAAVDGRVSAESIEAVKTLYPGIYNDFRQQLFERVAMKGKPIPRQSAVALSLMFDVPLTPIMRPDVRAALRAPPQPEPQQDKPRMPPSKPAAVSSLRTADQSRLAR